MIIQSVIVLDSSICDARNRLWWLCSSMCQFPYNDVFQDQLGIPSILEHKILLKVNFYSVISLSFQLHREIMPLGIARACTTLNHSGICQSGERRRGRHYLFMIPLSKMQTSKMLLTLDEMSDTA